MTEISLPPSPLPLAAAAPSTGDGTGPIPGANAPSDLQSSPFAALLMQQMATGIASAAKAAPSSGLPIEANIAAAVGPASAGGEDLLQDMLALLDPASLPPVAEATAAASASTNIPSDSVTESATALTVATILPEAAATTTPLIATTAIPSAANAALPSPVEDAEAAAAGRPVRSGLENAASAILAGGAGKKIAAGNEAGKGLETVSALAAAQEPQGVPRSEGAAPHTPSINAQHGQANRIDAPLGSRHWDGEFANKLTWMVTRNEQRADLILNPPQLGRVEVSLSVHGEQATAIFTSANAGVREAIEQAMPRLREVLLESGINLGQAHVGSESPHQSPGRNENRDNRANVLAAAGSVATATGLPGAEAANALRGGRGLVDIFA